MKNNRLRIIGGSLRGRKITIPKSETLRPTAIRIRETLFNWLTPHLVNSVCLDLFSGSGSLSFEALSRGAAKVIMIDESTVVISHLNKVAKEFKLGNYKAIRAHLPSKLSIEKHSINIVFIDPPFNKGLAPPICEWLSSMQWLKKEALIYLEIEKSSRPVKLPSTWKILKEKTAGQVAYFLISANNENISSQF